MRVTRSGKNKRGRKWGVFGGIFDGVSRIQKPQKRKSSVSRGNECLLTSENPSMDPPLSGKVAPSDLSLNQSISDKNGVLHVRRSPRLVADLRSPRHPQLRRSPRIPKLQGSLKKVAPTPSRRRALSGRSSRSRPVQKSPKPTRLPGSSPCQPQRKSSRICQLQRSPTTVVATPSPRSAVSRRLSRSSSTHKPSKSTRSPKSSPCQQLRRSPRLGNQRQSQSKVDTDISHNQATPNQPKPPTNHKAQQPKCGAVPKSVTKASRPSRTSRKPKNISPSLVNAISKRSRPAKLPLSPSASGNATKNQAIPRRRNRAACRSIRSTPCKLDSPTNRSGHKPAKVRSEVKGRNKKLKLLLTEYNKLLKKAKQLINSTRARKRARVASSWTTFANIGAMMAISLDFEAMGKKGLSLAKSVGTARTVNPTQKASPSPSARRPSSPKEKTIARPLLEPRRMSQRLLQMKLRQSSAGIQLGRRIASLSRSMLALQRAADTRTPLTAAGALRKRSQTGAKRAKSSSKGVSRQSSNTLKKRRRRNDQPVRRSPHQSSSRAANVSHYLSALPGQSKIGPVSSRLYNTARRLAPKMSRQKKNVKGTQSGQSVQNISDTLSGLSSASQGGRLQQKPVSASPSVKSYGSQSQRQKWRPAQQKKLTTSSSNSFKYRRPDCRNQTSTYQYNVFSSPPMSKAKASKRKRQNAKRQRSAPLKAAKTTKKRTIKAKAGKPGSPRRKPFRPEMPTSGESKVGTTKLSKTRSEQGKAPINVGRRTAAGPRASSGAQRVSKVLFHLNEAAGAALKSMAPHIDKAEAASH